MSSPRVLITGGPGFIGRRVVDRFRGAGWDVSSLSLPGEAPQSHWGQSVRMIFGDLTDESVTVKLTTENDLIIHLAAVVGLPGEYQRQWDIIAEGTRHICRAAKNARILVASSVAVYGDRIQTSLCNEETPLGAWQGAYGRAKQAQEDIARAEAANVGAELTIIRPANVYGLGGASAWGDKLLAAFKENGGAVVGEASQNNAGLVYVENLADAIFLASTKPEAIGRVYNVCDGEPTTWREFADDMAAIVGRAPPPTIPLDALLSAALTNEDPAKLIGPRDLSVPSLEALNLVGYNNRFPSEKIRSEIGWMPRIHYKDAVAEIKSQYVETAA
ncbi:MAG: NAD(P)-dependent oxidoreductase [Hyphomonadaceae bacterium JAD_PAG50586_4]|nr:MAG: NAD(P)-dependent oxidoreductase [Hyphomonadaceae bacterium JAD_PAG50586_4]